MMDTPLNAWSLFGNVARHHPRVEVVTASSGHEPHRYTYAEFSSRTQQLMHALDGLGLARGARVATLAWNGYRHLEAYFAIPCTARVLHTVNIRLSADDLAYVLDHAGDEAILVDPEFLPIVEQIADRLPRLRHIVTLDDVYEDLLAEQPTACAHRHPQTRRSVSAHVGYDGTTEGRRYTHRSTFLHALASHRALR
jgi:fatty-acyl-CoA synthase